VGILFFDTHQIRSSPKKITKGFGSFFLKRKLIYQVRVSIFIKKNYSVLTILALTNLRIAGHHLAVLANRLLLFFLINNNNENVNKITNFILIFKNNKITK